MKLKTLTKIFASISLGTIVMAVPLIFTTSCSDTEPASIKSIEVTLNAETPTNLIKNENGFYEISSETPLSEVKSLKKVSITYSGKMNIETAKQPSAVITLNCDGVHVTDTCSFPCSLVSYNETENTSTITWIVDPISKHLLNTPAEESYELEIYLKGYKTEQDSSNGIASGAKIIYSNKIAK